ncbi:MAG: CpXC domain-containing protein [Clostridia bacterium]|nr:CpXC domain-containing protein [Clostridia bacterium]
MSNTEIKKVSCPKCNHDNEVKVFKTVNATTDPQFRETLLAGQLFGFRCENCGYEATLRYPLLYNDMKNRFMVYYIPEIERERITDESLEAEYGDLGDVTRRIVGTFNELKEKIHIFESGLDDRAIEIAKIALNDVVTKRTGEAVTGGYFSKYSVEEGSIGFTFFVGDNNEHLVQTTRIEIYEKSVEIADFYDIDQSSRSFILINRDWARNALYKYKKSK